VARLTERHEVLRMHAGNSARRPDMLAVEEPLEIRLGGRPVSVTMRTPGHDFELAIGFLLTEGVVADRADVARIRSCAPPGEPNTYNVVDVTLRPGTAVPEPGLQRNFYATSSCGVCGKASVAAIRARTRHPVAADPVRVDPAVLAGLPERLRAEQRVFQHTGGLHAAGLFDPDGEPLCVREDIGRHNAVDKVIGWAAREDRLPLAGCLLMVSGRASFELVQKAVMAGVPVLAAISAPSSLAVALARDSGMTLVGFLRGSSLNVYTGRQRLVGAG
jgi:FdhD protein